MSYNAIVEKFRDEEYPYLIGKTYLDHGGTTLYAKSLVDNFSTDLLSNLYGNPHSASTPSAVAGHRVDDIREKALRFFNADPEHFDLVFVSNATAAIKLVMDCFEDYAAAADEKNKKQGFWYGYHKDAHNSIVGVRENAKTHRCFESDKEVEDWIRFGTQWNGVRAKVGLFAFPGQSNMTGRRLPMSWCTKIRRANTRERKTYTLLDAAALATSAPLDLSNPSTSPDFTCVSFYKIFGFPNVGALIVRKRSAHVLQKRRYFGGGTVDLVITLGSSVHYRRETSLHDQLEDGTLPFHSIFALGAAIDVHAKLFTSMESISKHTAYLARYMYSKLASLAWSNGRPMLRIYNESPAAYGNATLQGATIAFNVHGDDGGLIPCSTIEELADENKIYIRSGGLCNPGGIASYLGYTSAYLKRAHALGHRCSDPSSYSQLTGVVRVSLGAMSIKADVDRLFEFFLNMIVTREQLAQEEQVVRSEKALASSQQEEVHSFESSPRTSSRTSEPSSSSSCLKECVITTVKAMRKKFKSLAIRRDWFRKGAGKTKKTRKTA